MSGLRFSFRRKTVNMKYDFKENSKNSLVPPPRRNTIFSTGSFPHNEEQSLQDPKTLKKLLKKIKEKESFVKKQEEEMEKLSLELQNKQQNLNELQTKLNLKQKDIKEKEKQLQKEQEMFRIARIKTQKERDNFYKFKEQKKGEMKWKIIQSLQNKNYFDFD
ncbi:kinetochore scaffold [Anaeramoeba flamelloides]|uniref:Kinetochore scaffold n=1 Tax=Anaeramoeba flamelloides TaxID=1746091 RepID=A0AAV7YYP4_9EUKA|nr:kinetochore scaffold [Anaeramoeba flamelloides]